MMTTPLSIVPHNAYAFYYDVDDNLVHRQAICGVAMVYIDPQTKDDKGIAHPGETTTRFVIAYADGEIEYDVHLQSQKDFLFYSEDGAPSMPRLTAAVEAWHERHGVERKSNLQGFPPIAGWH